MKKILSIVTICFMLLVIGCGKDSLKEVSGTTPDSATERTADQGANDVSIPDDPAHQIIAKANYIIVDVRTREEYDQSRVVGAIHIPASEFNDSIGLPKDKTILVYCQDGTNSKVVCNVLSELGYDSFDLGAYDTVTLEKE